MSVRASSSSWPGIRWDDGISVFTRRTVDPATQPLDLEYLTEQVLRSVNGDAEDDVVKAYLIAATQMAEDDTQRALVPQTWETVLSGFPAGQVIKLDRPPLIAVSTIDYYDTANELQTLTGSPAEFDVLPSGAYSKAEIRPLDGTSFPSTYARPDAVTVTYRAGYESASNPVYSLIKVGIGLMVGELYKQRTLSVQSLRNTPAMVQIERLWRRVY